MGLGKMVTRVGPGPTAVRSIDSFAGYSAAGKLLQAQPGGAPWEISGQSDIAVYRGILSIPGVWRAVQILSDLLGATPWAMYDEDEAGVLTRTHPQPPLITSPAPPDTPVITRSSMAIDLVVHGNAIARILERDPDGEPTLIQPVPAAWSGVRWTTENAYGIRRREYFLNGERVDQDDVIHVKGMTVPGQLWGMGVLEAHFFGAFRLAHELNRQAGDLGLNSVPTGVFKSGDPDLDADGAASIKHTWQQAMQRRTIAVISKDDEFEALSWNPEQAQLIEARQFSLTEIALIFGLPPSMLGAPTGDSLTYGNRSSDALELLKFSLNGHLVRFEEAWTKECPPGRRVRADLNQLLRSDTLTRYQAYQAGIQAGWMRRSEVRQAESLPAVPGIDDAPPTDAVQLKLNKEEPVDVPAILQPKGSME